MNTIKPPRPTWRLVRLRMGDEDHPALLTLLVFLQGDGDGDLVCIPELHRVQDKGSQSVLGEIGPLPLGQDEDGGFIPFAELSDLDVASDVTSLLGRDHFRCPVHCRCRVNCHRFRPFATANDQQQ